MNRSQLLYKISMLEYNIRLKETEYAYAAKQNDPYSMGVCHTALSCLKQDLAATRNAFEEEEPVIAETAPVVKKTSWWYLFFPPRISPGKKS